MKGVEVIKDSVELWSKLLSYYVNFDSLDMAIEAFQAGVRSLKHRSMPLWKIIILYMHSTHPELVMIHLYLCFNQYYIQVITTICFFTA